jgi:YD repeat-containing protein
LLILKMKVILKVNKSSWRQRLHWDAYELLVEKA